MKKVFVQSRGGGRDNAIDILKGICIILVVYGHTFPSCRQFIYLFHLPAFVFASGYLYSGNMSSASAWGKYLWKKAKTLYIPLIVYNSLFIILNNIFVKSGIYTTDENFLLLTNSYPVKQHLYGSMDLMQTIKGILSVFLLVHRSQLGGPTWYIISLLFLLFCYSLFELIASKFSGICSKSLKTFIFLGMLILAQVVSDKRPNVFFPIKLLPCMWVTFQIGRWAREYGLVRYINWKTALISLCCLLFFSTFLSIEMSVGKISNVVGFVFVSICGWIMLYYISVQFERFQCVFKCLSYLGKHTMPILCLHTLCFKLVSYIYIITNSIPRVLLASYPVVIIDNEMWKLLYTFVGICMPVALNHIWIRLTTIRNK